jgi:8-amino-7-oxononanoate synthase
MDHIHSWMQEELAELKNLGRFRQLTDYSGWIDFCSNDYLGLGRDRALDASIEKYLTLWNRPSYSSSGSRLISGQGAYHEETEKFIAQQHGAEAALLMDNGYLANHALMTALGQRGTTFILDAHCHASIIRSAHQSQADKIFKFAHNHIESLEQKLSMSEGRVIVVIESVYSMDGDCSNVNAILELCAQYHAQLIIDEAHAFGWKGTHRIGEEIPSHKALLARVFTYGKGAGCHGAAITGSKILREFLINTCAPFIYSTATTPHTVAAIRSAYDYVLQHSDRTAALKNNIAYWRDQMGATTSQEGPIQIVRHAAAKAIAERAQQNGFGIKAILSPTVKPEHTCVRICLHSFQTKEDIQRLIQIIQEQQ